MDKATIGTILGRWSVDNFDRLKHGDQEFHDWVDMAKKKDSISDKEMLYKSFDIILKNA